MATLELFLRENSALRFKPDLTAVSINTIDDLKTWLDLRKPIPGIDQTTLGNWRAIILGRSATTPHRTRLPVIHFYDKDKPFYEFTNFYPAPFADEQGQQWQTSEHYFQAMKFVGNSQVMAYIQAAPSPKEAFDRAHEYVALERKDWLEKRVDVMRMALKLKFSSHPHLQYLLQSTRDAVLVEHTNKDAFWGDGGDGRGESKLGELLMELRKQLPPLA